jgi:predicted ABC-type ATPase
MRAPYPSLSEDAHQRILEQKVLREPEFLNATAQDRPRAVLLAGQPGSGKGGFADAAKLELGGDAVTVDPDALRQYHPRIHALQREFPYTWSGQTHADASQWADEYREAIVASRTNLILDTTLSNGEWTSEMINDLKTKGYEVEVRAVVAHRLESEHGVDERFSSRVDRQGVGRHVPEEVRTAIYDKIPAALDTVHARTGVPIRLYSREGVELYDSRNSAQLPGEALSAARDARLRDPAVLRQLEEGWSQQRDWHRTLPERLPDNPRVDAPTAQRLLAERAERGIVENVGRSADQAAQLAEAQGLRATQGVAGPGLARGAIAVGVVVATVDAYSTGRDVARAYSQDNPTAAEAKLFDFSARTGGGVAGAGLGFAAGSALGTPVIGGVIGGGLGYVGGNAVAEWRHREAIYTQRDERGREWRMDPERPEQGWQHVENRRTGAMQSTERIVHPADAALTSELNFKASTVSLERALGDARARADPYRLPRSAGDAPSVPDTPWVLDPANGQWTRQRYALQDDGTDLGKQVKVGDGADSGPDRATPERAAQLDAQSRQIIEANAAMSAPVMAARFNEAHRTQGWEAYGAVSQAISHARSRRDEITASDERTYVRQEDGRWLSEQVGRDRIANPLIQRELEATRLSALRQAEFLDPQQQELIKREAVGPAKPEASSEPPRATLPVDFAPPQTKGPDLRDSTHPGHHAFREMVHRVGNFELQNDIPSGPHTERLGAALLQIAVENKVHYQSAFLERDAATGRVQMLDRTNSAPYESARRIDLDMARLSTQPIEESSRLTNEAVSRHYDGAVQARAVVQTRTAEQAQALASLSFDDQVMFGRIRRDLPGHIGDDHVMQAMAEAKRSEIRDSASVGGVMILGDRIRVMGRGDAPPSAQVDVTQPAPKADMSLASITTLNQQHAIDQQWAQQQAQQQNAGMRMV